MVDNTPARAFWRKVIAERSHNRFTDQISYFDEYQGEMVVQTFSSPGM